MEFLHLDHSLVELHEGPVTVRHGDTGFDHVLIDGQHLVIGDRDGEFHDGLVMWVEDREDEPEGPIYHVLAGVRLPMDAAAQRLADVDMLPENRAMHQLLDLLGALAEEERKPQG
jgi:hypothetical protein